MTVVSVIIPVYNAEKTVQKALQSVAAQDFAESVEIVLTDDGSTDASLETVNRFLQQHQIPHIIISQKNSGVSKARNEAMKKATGKYFAFLDADDEWLLDKLETQIGMMEELELDFLAAKRTNQQILYPYRVSENGLAEITFPKLLIRNEVHPSTVIISRKVTEKTGMFDEKQRYAEDVNYWMRISEHHRMYILDKPLVFAGGGKRTFGVSGLSANLKLMDQGLRKNLHDMYKAGRLSYPKLQFYRFFYRLKYFVLTLRSKM